MKDGFFTQNHEFAIRSLESRMAEIEKTVERLRRNSESAGTPPMTDEPTLNERGGLTSFGSSFPCSGGSQ